MARLLLLYIVEIDSFVGKESELYDSDSAGCVGFWHE